MAYENTCEIAIEWVKGQQRATITAYSNSKIKGKLIKLAEKFPDEVDVYLNEDGSVLGHVPINYIKVSHPKQVSEETKIRLAERLRDMKNVQ